MPTKQILIADDEPAIRALLRLLFEHLGYQVIEARNGREAVELAKAQLPDLLVFDLQMPEMTGVEAIKQIRTDPRLAQSPAIALTAYVRDFLPPEVLAAGFSRFVPKPFEMSDLQDAATALLR